MTSTQELRIHITFFFNPHHFLFKIVRNDNKLTQLEFDIFKYVSNKKFSERSKRKFACGDFVLYHNIKTNQWNRARVFGETSAVNEMSTFDIWLLDHGYPEKTIRYYMIPMPDRFRNIQVTSIFQGGISDIMQIYWVFSI